MPARERSARDLHRMGTGRQQMLWRVMADIVVAVHATYVAIVIVGLAAIFIGSAAQWRWVRNFCFRAAHLVMILLVCAEALVGTTCPLTRLENTLRLRGGETGYASDFIGYWLDWLIFYDAPSWVFTVVYLTFGMLVLSTLWLAPVRWPLRRRTHSEPSSCEESGSERTQ
jgi:hypothetical protein